MKSARYTPEFKAEAIKQITERGHGVLEVSKRLGVSDKSLYLWLKQSREEISHLKSMNKSIKTNLTSCPVFVDHYTSCKPSGLMMRMCGIQ